jgi:Beta-lactamase
MEISDAWTSELGARLRRVGWFTRCGSAGVHRPRSGGGPAEWGAHTGTPAQAIRGGVPAGRVLDPPGSHTPPPTPRSPPRCARPRTPGRGPGTAGLRGGRRSDGARSPPCGGDRQGRPARLGLPQPENPPSRGTPDAHPARPRPHLDLVPRHHHVHRMPSASSRAPAGRASGRPSAGEGTTLDAGAAVPTQSWPAQAFHDHQARPPSRCDDLLAVMVDIHMTFNDHTPVMNAAHRTPTDPDQFEQRSCRAATGRAGPALGARRTTRLQPRPPAPDRAPGKRFAYSDTGYVLLGRILEETTGRSFHELLMSAVVWPDRRFGSAGRARRLFRLLEIIQPLRPAGGRARTLRDEAGTARRTVFSCAPSFVPCGTSQAPRTPRQGSGATGCS